MTLFRRKRGMADQRWQRPRTARRSAGCHVTAGHHRPGGSGVSRLASAAAPGSVRTLKGAAFADAPGADSPRLPADAIGLVVLPVSVHAFVLGQLAPFCGGAGPEARRWRAGGAPLKIVEKIVTG